MCVWWYFLRCCPFWNLKDKGKHLPAFSSLKYNTVIDSHHECYSEWHHRQMDGGIMIVTVCSFQFNRPRFMNGAPHIFVWCVFGIIFLKREFNVFCAWCSNFQNFLGAHAPANPPPRRPRTNGKNWKYLHFTVRPLTSTNPYCASCKFWSMPLLALFSSYMLFHVIIERKIEIKLDIWCPLGGGWGNI